MKTWMGKIRYKLSLVKITVIFLTVYAISGFYKKKERFTRLWLISERGDDARDNAWYLFRYIREVYPDCNIRYVITDDSPDGDKVRALGSAVRFGGLEHYLSIILAEVLISTHTLGYTTNDYLFKRFERWGLLKGKRIFLQHGVTKDDVPSMHYGKTRPDLFVCAVRPEAEFVVQCLEQPRKAVRLLGFCRYDGLPMGRLEGRERSAGRKILLMPTWRHDLFFYSAGDFVKTEYFQCWQSLLLSEKMKRLLEQYECQLYFYPHHQMQKFLPKFRTDSGRVHILSCFDADVQKLLIDTDLLITDFSSVFFDYAYMGKPMIYFQFDREEYRSKNYQEGWFSYEKHGFGKVTDTASETLEELERILKNGVTMDTVYQERRKELFEYEDHENCKRNYDAIRELLDYDRR